MPATIAISNAKDSELNEIRTLLREYESELHVSLCFQGFDEELAALPGKYAPPSGRLLIARVDGNAAGCIALRRIDDAACEMKRLYVRPDFRATGLGRQLAERVIAEARGIGYARMCLDTMPSMQRAQKLYESLGFTDIEPYTHNPVAGTRYLGLTL